MATAALKHHEYSSNCECPKCAKRVHNSRALAEELAHAIRGAITDGLSAKLTDILTRHLPPSVSTAEKTYTTLTLIASVEALFNEVHALRGQVKALEARPQFKDCGIWDGLRTYQPGDHVSDRGSYWACRAPNLSQRPGTASTAAYWRLVSKSGEPR